MAWWPWARPWCTTGSGCARPRPRVREKRLEQPARIRGILAGLGLMPLLDRFRSRPAWQSKDPEIRASAVRQLGAEQQELLAGIAREDADPRVRRLAVRKIHDAATLAAIAREDADTGVRGEAASGLERLA